MNRESETLNPERLRRRVRWMVSLVIAGLVTSGLTAIPIATQFQWAAGWLGSDFRGGGWVPVSAAEWLSRVARGVAATTESAPYLWYGTDWLAFGHFVIAIAFIGAWRHPVRNAWLFDFGLIAGALVIPWALVFGALRGIPPWWRMIDCTFGVLVCLPLWQARRWTRELAAFRNRD